MSDTIRKQVIAGNWKMYKTSAEAVSFVETILPLIHSSERLVYLAVPFTAIAPAAKEARDSIRIGAQNMHDASDGAFTGEIAAQMILEAGGRFVLLGHSERRKKFGEDDVFINRKVKRALHDQLQAILCVGETMQERQAGRTEQVLRQQLEAGLRDVTAEQLSSMLIAYEPVWAIGTGEAASPEQAEEAHLICRNILTEHWGAETANKVSILYGGSVAVENAAILLAEPNIDGLLVGRASLEPEIFAKIVNA